MTHCSPETGALLDQIDDTLAQAQDCIRGETPEDVSDEEARANTISEVREAMRSVERLRTIVAQSTVRDRADYKIGAWLSAALEDPAACAEFKADIHAWFEAHQPGLISGNYILDSLVNILFGAIVGFGFIALLEVGYRILFGGS